MAIEVGFWTAVPAAEIDVQGSWHLEYASPGFPKGIPADLLAILGEGRLRASAIDAEANPIIGVRVAPIPMTAFSFFGDFGEEPDRLGLWIAVAVGTGIGFSSFLKGWHRLASTRRAPDLRTGRAVPEQKFLGSWAQVQPSPRASSPPGGLAHENIAVLHEKPETRLTMLAQIVGALRSRDQARPLFVVDNVTCVQGRAVQVAGLVPSPRFQGSEWLLVAPEAPADLEQELRNALAAFPSAQEADAGHAEDSAPPGGERRSPPAMGAADLIRLAEEIVAHELDAAAHDAPADAARRLFETDAPSRPEAAGATAHPAWRAAGAIMVRAELLRQFPGLMQVAPEAFAAWAVNVAEARLALHAAIAGHMAQRCYDLARGVGVDRCPDLHWLDRLVDALLARAGDALVAATSPTGRSSEPGLPWPQEEDDAVVAAFDALGEMETLAPERDRRAQAAGDTVRLLLGRVTADAIWRLTQRALQGDGAVQSALQCAPIAGPLHGLATLVMSDGRSWDIATARTAAARLLGRNAPDADAALRLRSLSSDDPHRTRHRP